MKKSFMTRVLAVSLSAAMAFSMSSASNLMTASAASTVNLKTTFKTLKVNQTYKLTLKNNTLNWKITKVTTSNKKICTVYGKTASSVMLKGKGVGRAKITVKVKTTKRKYPNNIKLMKCTANVKAATDPGQTTTTFSASAAANSNTEVRVTFNQEIDTPEAANFTVSDGVTVSKAELSTDKKSVLLTIAGAEYGKNYDLTVSGIKVAGKEQAEQKLTFTTPAATEKYPMTLEAKDKILKSDGQTQTVVTFTIKDENGNLITDKGVEVAFTTSLGKFAEQRVSIQNGVATVMYTSEALMETQTAAITATVVESTDNQELMGLTTSSSITLTPNPEALEDTSIGAIITSATAPTADRIIAYFNQKVEAKDFKTSSGKIDKSKFDCTIQSGLDNGFAYVDDNNSSTHNVVGILDVPSDENALQLLVDKPMIDNTNVKVEFDNKTKTNTLGTAKNIVYFKLTDAHQPSVLNAEGDGLWTVTVKFSEAVLPTDYCSGKGIANQPNATVFAADNIENYLIDGKPLSYYGVDTVKSPEEEGQDSTDGSIKKISSKKDDPKTGNTKLGGEIRVGSYKEGEDKRDTVTIKLGREHYLTPGIHSMSISNVGDWAAKTDRERNIVNTQSFDFTVQENDVIPTFEVVEQSPEQYLLKFNADIEPVDQTFTTPDSQLTPSVLKLQQLVGSTWVDITDSTASGKNPIRVSQVDDSRDYVVEVLKDWTQVYNTAGTRMNYFNYDLRLHVDAGKLFNTANNKQNAVIDIPLNGSVMKNPDVESPVIGDIVSAEDKSGNLTDSYNVTLSEPVKLTDGKNANGANGEGLTPSQTQVANAGSNNNADRQGVPMPSAQFIRVDNGQTVDGYISGDAFIDAMDTTINVAPESPLSAGKWRLVMSSISDDYGNTASTVAHEIDVTREIVSNDFKVVWAAVSTKETGATLADKITYNPSYIGKNPDNGTTRGRYIFVKFNKPITMSGNSVNAGVTGNYTVNGATLPTGTQIRANIQGYDSHDNVTDSITIILPEGNVNSYNEAFTVDATNAMLNISRAITSTTGETLANGGMIRLPFQYGSAVQSNDGYNKDFIKTLTTKNDAVWGNDDTERISGVTGAPANLKEYYQRLKSALESDEYRRIILHEDLDLTKIDNGSDAQKDAVSVFGRSRTLTINRAVDIDLNSHHILGNVVVSTSDAVDKIKIYSSTGNMTTNYIKGYAENKSNVATLTVDAGSAYDFEIENVKVERGNNDSLAININDAFVNTFKNLGIIDGGIRITDKNGVGFENVAGTGVLRNAYLTVDSNGEVNLKGDLSTLEGITLTQAAKMFFRAANIKGRNIRVAGAGARVIFDAGTITDTNTVLTSEADNVRVQLSKEAADGGIKFTVDKGGKIVSVNDKDQEISATEGTDAVKIDTINTSGVQKVLEHLNLCTAIYNADEAFPATYTTSAAVVASGSGLNVSNLKKSIKELKVTDPTTKEEITGIVANYTLMSSDVVETNADGNIVIKKEPKANAVDELKVVLSYNGYVVTRTIRITNQ